MPDPHRSSRGRGGLGAAKVVICVIVGAFLAACKLEPPVGGPPDRPSRSANPLPPTPSTTNAATTNPAPTTIHTAPTTTVVADDHPIRAAFYYPWFPETWQAPGGGTYTNFHPTGGLYDSSDPATIARHLDELAYAHVDVAISSWWGRGTPTATRFETLVAASAGSAIKWAIYYEPEGYADPSTNAIVADLGPTIQAHAGDQRILRLDGRFVVFVYGDGHDDCGMASRWKRAAEQLDIYVVLKVFPSYQQCTLQPDAWHQYAPANAVDAQLPWSFAVSPGFWLYGQSPRLARDPAGFRASVSAMVASGAKFQLITTFNEWGEGTAVEPATEWTSASGYGLFLDILHEIPPR